MTDIEERIKEIEDEIRRTPYNKASEKHIGKLKAKLARLKDSAAVRRGGVREEGLRKAGDATVALVGLPSVGKSTLLNQVTEAESRVGSYDFTTLKAVPGLLNHRGARIQLIDLPGITQGAASGRGRGREVFSKARMADLLLLMIDVERMDLEGLLGEIGESGIRVNQDPPRIALHPKDRGGIDVSFVGEPRGLEEETVRDILREWGVVNADIVIPGDISADSLIDYLAGNRVYVPGMVVLNKIDLAGAGELEPKTKTLEGWRVVAISAKEGTGIPELLDTIYSLLSLFRVYLRPPKGKGGSEEALVLRRGATVENVCRVLHGHLVRRFRYALVWGPSARFPGQRVGMGHRLEEGDRLTIVTRKGWTSDSH